MATTGKRISYDDLVEPGIVEKLRKEILDLKKVIDSLGGDKGGNVRQFNDALKDTTEITEDLIRIQKAQIRLEKDINIILERKKALAEKHRELSLNDELQLTKLKKLKEANNRELANEAKLTNNLNDSMVRLSLSLAKNKAEYRKLTKEERDNKKIGGELIKTIKSQDEEIKKLDKSIGDNQRSVGDYSIATKGLTGIMGSFGTTINNVTNNFGNFKTAILGVGKAQIAAAKGSSVMTIAMKILRGAVIATGIGALVIAVISLVSWFKNTWVGAEKLRKIMVPLNAIFNVITTTLQDIGEGLSKIFSGDFLGGIAAMTNAVSDLSGQYERQLKIETQIADLKNRLFIVQTQNLTRIKELEAEAAEQRKIAMDDANYSTAQQQDALNKSAAALTEINRIRQEELGIQIAQAALDIQGGNESPEQLKKLAELKAQQFVAEKSMQTQLITIAGRRNTILIKQQREQNAAIIGGLQTVKSVEVLKTEALETGLQERFFMQERHAENIDELNAMTFEKEAERQQLQNELVIKGFADTFGQLSNIVERNTVEWQLLSVAQATLNAFLAASQALADWKTFDPIQKVAAAFATLGVGLGFVTQMNRIGFAEGTDNVLGGQEGKDSVNALLMPHERVLTVDQNKPLLQMGVSNKDIPGLVAMGLQSNQDGLQSSHLLQLQLLEQKKMNEGIRNIDNVWMDKDGNRVIQNKTSKKTFVN